MTVGCRRVATIGQRIPWGHAAWSGVKKFDEVVGTILVKPNYGYI